MALELDRARSASSGLALGIGVGMGVLAFVIPALASSVIFETLALAQASFLAIVVSVSLLSVQVSSSRYAPLLSSIYREGAFNRLIARFGASILIDLSLIGIVRTSAVTSRPAVGAGAVGVAFLVATWSFLGLLSIERRLLAFLNPEPVLSDLVEEVSFERYRTFATRHREEGPITRNPILEIFQVARTALDGNDNYGALQAVRALERATLGILDDIDERAGEHDDDIESIETVHQLFDYWNQISVTAMDEGADDVLHAIVEAEVAIGEEALDRGIEPLAIEAIRSVGRFCAVAADHDRLETRHVTALGDLLEAGLAAGVPSAARAALDALLGLFERVHARSIGYVVADPSSAIASEICDGWAASLRTDGDERLPDRFDRACREIVAAAADTSGERRALVEGFGRVGTVATERDRPEDVRRIVRLLVALGVAGSDRDAIAGALADITAVAQGGSVVHEELDRLRSGATGEDVPGATDETRVTTTVEDLQRAIGGRDRITRDR